VFWCADKGIFALLVLFKKVPTLVFNGNVKFRKPQGGGMMCFDVQIRVFLPYLCYLKGPHPSI
jgi:hypothetical protein